MRVKSWSCIQIIISINHSNGEITNIRFKSANLKHHNPSHNQRNHRPIGKELIEKNQDFNIDFRSKTRKFFKNRKFSKNRFFTGNSSSAQKLITESFVNSLPCYGTYLTHSNPKNSDGDTLNSHFIFSDIEWKQETPMSQANIQSQFTEDMEE